MEGGGPVPIWFVLVFCAVEVVVVWVVVFFLFCKKSFRFDSASLTIETKVLGYRRIKVIPKDSIRKLVQIKDGGGENDSFPSWALKVEVGKDDPVTLIFRQPYDSSHWLGSVLARWADVEFDEAPREDEASTE